MGLSTRKLLVGLSAAGVVAAGFGVTGQAAADTATPSSTTTDAAVPGTTTQAAPPATPLTTTSATPPVTTTSATPPPPEDNVGGDDSGGEGRQHAQKVREEREAAARKAKTDGRKVTRSARKSTAKDDEAPRKAKKKNAEKKADAAQDQAAADDATTDAPLDDSAVTATDALATDAAPVGVPNFFIDQFQIPPFLLPIYQAAGIQYGIRWEILAAINEIETNYGRNLSVSTAGALGWMQFMPPTWASYGVDANGDEKADPYNPVDAIFAAARYLKAAGADTDIRKAIFAYNHADWYVDSVLMRARLISGLPDDLVGSLTGLTQGIFPVTGDAQYVGDDANAKARTKTTTGNAAKPVASGNQRSIDIRAAAGSPATAVQDGTIVGLGENDKLGKFLRLRDVYGNTYTYSGLRSISAYYPVAKAQPTTSAKSATHDKPPTSAATAGKQKSPARTTDAPASPPTPDAVAAPGGPQVTDGEDRRDDRQFAHPLRPEPQRHGGDEQLVAAPAGDSSYSSYLTEFSGLSPEDIRLKPMKRGAHVMAGTVLGRLGKGSQGQAPRLRFAIRPAGKGAPRIDPKPILDGWKLLESTAVYRAKDTTPLFRAAGGASAGQVLLMSKQQLQERALVDPNLSLPAAAQQQIRSGAIDQRVLATLEYLTANGLQISVSSLGRPGAITSSGNVSEHSSGNAVDIASVNGVRIEPSSQGSGSITDTTIRLLLQLQGTMKPHQIISLMPAADFGGADNVMALPDHGDHIHVGFQPAVTGDAQLGKQVAEILKPAQWVKLIDRIGAIDNPTVLEKPSKYALRLPKSGK